VITSTPPTSTPPTSTPVTAIVHEIVVVLGSGFSSGFDTGYG